MLDVLLSRKMSYAAKKDILTAEYGLPFTEPFDRRFLDMCNFSTGIFEEGRMEGRVSAIASNIRSVMENFHVTLEAALDTLKVPTELRPAVMKELG